jgi:protein gp37
MKGKSQPAATEKARLVILLWLLFPGYEGKKMGVKSSIEWTESTWNPVTGCTKISEGCAHCYAERMALRLKAMGQKNYIDGFKVTLHPHVLDLPLTWKKPQTIFVNSMSDLFHNDIPISFIRKVFDVMERAHWHRFQILTKRAERLSELASLLNWSENIWIGVTVENCSCSKRIDYLRNIPAAVRFLSLEPLLEPLPNMDLSDIDWVIVGGESGPGARPMNKKWVLDIQEQCCKANVPFFFKQWGGVNKKKAGRLLNGRVYNEMPKQDSLTFTACG